MAAIASLTTREYSSGSCTLRITGQLSPLSQVADKPVLVRSRFNLQLLPEHEFAPSTPRPPSPSAAASPPCLELSGKAEQFSALAATVNHYVQGRLTLANPTGQSSFPKDLSGEILLQPLGLTRHRLILPPELGSKPENTVDLSALELVDLAEVLDLADADFYFPTEAALPQKPAAKPRLPIWIGSAAAVGIAAILGSQWLPLQTPLTHLPTATREADVALEDSPEIEPPSQHQTPKLESVPATEAPESSESPDSATVGENRREVSAPSRQPVTPVDRPPSADHSSNTTLPPPATTDRPFAIRETAPQAPAAAPVPPSQSVLSAPTAAPETAQSPTATPRTNDGATYSSPTSAPEAEMDTAESFAEPSSSPQRLRLPETANNTETAGAAPQQRSTDQLSDSTDAVLPWQEQFRQQLQGSWTPFPEQSEPLRYRLSINSDGTVRSIEPLSELSQQYQESIALPAPGSPLFQYPEGAASTLEVQFLPAGEVVVMPAAPDP